MIWQKFFCDSYLISLFANAEIINSSTEVKLVRNLVNKNILHYTFFLHIFLAG
jgi:hypothetical protein